jgi:hypothetical protein
MNQKSSLREVPHVVSGALTANTLLRKASWQLKQRPTWNSRYFSLNVAAPEGDLRVDGFEYRE